MRFLLMVSCHLTLILGRGVRGEDSTNVKILTSVDEMPDLSIEPYSYPPGYEGPDIMGCVTESDYSQCEQLLLRAAAKAQGDEEKLIYLYGTLGMMADFQGNLHNDPDKGRGHYDRALGYLAKAEELALKDTNKYRLHLASFISTQAGIHEYIGNLDQAVAKNKELAGYMGVGTGIKSNWLAVNAAVKVAALRLEAGDDTTEVKAYLDSLKGHPNEEIAFGAKKELLAFHLMKANVDSARKRLEDLKIEYAGRDSIGSLDLANEFRRAEHKVGTLENEL